MAEDSENEALLTEIPAREILDKIKKGEPVEYDHVRIKGELDLSELDFPTDHICWDGIQLRTLELPKESKVISFSINITNSEFDAEVNFGNNSFMSPVNFNSTTFSGDVTFSGAIFSEDVTFSRATFGGDADFSWSTFCGSVYFGEAIFRWNVDFYKATFNKYANFSMATFSWGADFHKATFRRRTFFLSSAFGGDVTFSEATLSGRANFRRATFSRKADFSMATFSWDADFSIATFSGSTDYGIATFSGKADFSEATFSEYVHFIKATFRGDAYFLKVTFRGDAYFLKATFNGDAKFDRATFESAEFGDATFSEKANFAGSQFRGDNLSFESAIFKDPQSQEEACRRAKNVLEKNGNREDADYHFYREMEAKRKQKLSGYEDFDYEALLFYEELRKETNLDSKKWGFIDNILNMLEYIFLQKIFGYGVHPFWLWGWWFFFVGIFAAIYWLGKGVNNAITAQPLTNPLDYIWFSITVAVTPGFAGNKPATGVYQVVAGLEAIFGTFMWAAFVTTFGKKFMR